MNSSNRGRFSPGIEKVGYTSGTDVSSSWLERKTSWKLGWMRLMDRFLR